MDHREQAVVVTTAKGAERRTSTRYRMSAPPEIEIFNSESGVPMKARLRDLSRGGCYAESDYSLPLGTEVSIKLINGGDEVKATAQVVRTTRNEGVAFQFTSMDGIGFRILDSWLSTFIVMTWTAANRRKTQRVTMQIDLRISGYDVKGVRFTEDTRTVEISPLGGSVILKNHVRIGQRVVLSNSQTKVTVECMVVHYETKGMARQVGLAFMIPNQSFWPLTFPAANRSPTNRTTKRYT